MTVGGRVGEGGSMADQEDTPPRQVLGNSWTPAHQGENAFSLCSRVGHSSLNLFRDECIYECSLTLQDSLPTTSLSKKRKQKRKEIRKFPEFCPNTFHTRQTTRASRDPRIKVEFAKGEGKEMPDLPGVHSPTTHPHQPENVPSPRLKAQGPPLCSINAK